MAFTKGNKLGNRFSSENQPVRNGRRPKVYTIARQAYNLSYEEFCRTLNYLYQCTKKELEEISEDENTPIWVLNICRAIHKDTGKGVLYTFKELADRLYGTARNNSSVDVTTNGKEVTMPSIVYQPTELTEKDLAEIQNIRDGKKSSQSDTSVSKTE